MGSGAEDCGHAKEEEGLTGLSPRAPGPRTSEGARSTVAVGAQPSHQRVAGRKKVLGGCAQAEPVGTPVGGEKKKDWVDGVEPRAQAIFPRPPFGGRGEGVGGWV